MDAPLSMQDAICVFLTASVYPAKHAHDFVLAARAQIEARGRVLIELADAQKLREMTEEALEDAKKQEESARQQAEQG